MNSNNLIENNGFASDELLAQLFYSIEMVGKFRQLMRDALTWIKRNYDAREFFKEYVSSDYFVKVMDKLKCELVFDNSTGILTMRSLLDKEIKESVQLLSGETWINWIDCELRKSRKEKKDGNDK